METNVCLNGQILPQSQAAISIDDAGFLHGASTFTTMRVHNGQVFRMDRHLHRLMETVGLLGIRTDATPESLKIAALATIAANSLSEARMRITLTPGSVHALPGSDVPHVPTTLVTMEPLADYFSQWAREGITVIVSSYRQAGGDPTFGYKTGCYLPRILARQEAAAKGAQEAIWFTSDNRLAEACFRNVFLVQGGKVYTPPIDTPILPGVVRAAVIELLPQLGLVVQDHAPLNVQHMLAANEIFLTGSGLGVCPVVRVERHAVGTEKPGPVTRQVQAAYEQLLDKECPAK
jgi:branched-subunit amino acid aminotransferase/4-amino-4-deoxychorismate lyase